jgi:hypothetical protein
MDVASLSKFDWPMGVNDEARLWQCRQLNRMMLQSGLDCPSGGLRIPDRLPMHNSSMSPPKDTGIKTTINSG